MPASPRLLTILAVLLSAVLAVPAGFGEEPPPAPARQLIGLWYAKRRFGPEVRGPLTIEKSAAGWQAQIAGREVKVALENDRLSFAVPDNQGSFRGRLEADGRIHGHWSQPATVSSGAGFATPVVLDAQAEGRWRGSVAPLDDEMTFHLRIYMGGVHGSGKVVGFLRNPERNAARFFDVEEVVLDGTAVKVMGKRGKDAPVGELFGGAYDAESRTLSLYLPWAGGTFDFHRATSSQESGYYPRERSPVRYTYRPPALNDDGWPVGTLQDAGISGDAIAAFINKLLIEPIDDVHALDLHALLVARHGKLVLEEYFHNFHRDALHDTRSASKSLTGTLIGAAMLKGAPLRADTRVYEVMEGAAAAAGRDERARAMTLEHLLTMSSGLACDDADEGSTGSEDVMQQQTAQPDWYRYTLDLEMARAPGEKAVYCSASPNLAGGMLARTTGRPLAELFDELIARPLQFGRYALNLMPTGEPYMGGGARVLPRDFMKLGQVMLDGGRWHGRPIVSADWAKKSTAPLRELREMQYGYLWWSKEYTLKDRKLRVFFAAGNGGQIVMGVPDLGLVAAFYGGNYSEPVALMAQNVFLPGYVLPAVN
jgi:CubicO group peptidase (beta-lactamase class C family)